MCGPDMVGPVCSPKKIEKPSQPGKRKAALPSFPPWDCIVFENSCTENCEGTPGIRVEMRESRGGVGLRAGILPHRGGSSKFTAQDLEADIYL